MNDFLPLQGIDHIELYVGNAKQAAHFYKTVFGFQSLAYAGPETGIKDRASYVLTQGNIRIVLTSPLEPSNDMAAQIHLHGDGVKVIALTVDDSLNAFSETMKRGARLYSMPERKEDEHGEVILSGIHIYGDTIHTFVERKNYSGIFLPGYKPWNPSFNPPDAGLTYIDHIVGNVGWNEMKTWADFYANTMGFSQFDSFDDKDIPLGDTALMSKVVANGKVKISINEPEEGKKKSQVAEYLDFYKGPGVQHIALGTGNIIESVKELQNRGAEFLQVPTTYDDDLSGRIGEIDEEISDLKKLGILVERDEDGYLLQIFTKPIEDRPTVFFEIIQRKR